MQTCALGSASYLKLDIARESLLPGLTQQWNYNLILMSKNPFLPKGNGLPFYKGVIVNLLLLRPLLRDRWYLKNTGYLPEPLEMHLASSHRRDLGKHRLDWTWARIWMMVVLGGEGDIGCRAGIDDLDVERVTVSLTGSQWQAIPLFSAPIQPRSTPSRLTLPVKKTWCAAHPWSIYRMVPSRRGVDFEFPWFDLGEKIIATCNRKAF